MKETDFIAAFGRARLAFKPATRSDGTDVNLEEECSDLVEYLLSDLPLTEGDRFILAAFFSGTALRPRGGQAKSIGDPIKQAVARHYIARRSQGLPKLNIYDEISERFGIKSRQTINNYLNDLGKSNWSEEQFNSEIVETGLKEIAEWSGRPFE